MFYYPFDFFPLAANAKISPIFFHNVTQYLNVGYYYDSPTLGAAALDSSYIYNLRFNGNIERAYTNDPRQRNYANDIGKDGLSKLVINLFPSTGGALTSESLVQKNFGRYVKNPETVSVLLNFISNCRKTGACTEINKYKEDAIKTIDQDILFDQQLAKIKLQKSEIEVAYPAIKDKLDKMNLTLTKTFTPVKYIGTTKANFSITLFALAANSDNGGQEIAMQRPRS